MKELHSLNLTKLTILEFGQHIKSINQNINQLGTTTDSVLLHYLATSNQQLAEYDKAMLQIRKSDETAKIVTADSKRDLAITSLQRQLNVFELSDDDNELLAFASINTLLKTYKGIQKWNFEEETNGIENLIADLKNSKYEPQINLLNMAGFVTKVNDTNQNFKALFDGRFQETADKAIYDTKALRATAKKTYVDMAEYVLAMSKAKDTNEFNKSLDVINAVRKYYADLLAKRKPATATVPVVEISPMN
ncbi:MAG: hypothetical protein H7174_08855 [Flavobacterium sp.]|nr:hypothetical protein [Flavobacterium sp.]